MHELNLQSPLLLNGKFFRLAIEFSMPSCGIAPEIIDPTSLAVFNLNPAHFDKSTVWQLSPDLIAKLIRLFELKHVIILTLASLRAPGSAASGTALPGNQKGLAGPRKAGPGRNRGEKGENGKTNRNKCGTLKGPARFVEVDAGLGRVKTRATLRLMAVADQPDIVLLARFPREVPVERFRTACSIGAGISVKTAP